MTPDDRGLVSPEVAMDAERLEWLFSDLDDRVIAAKLRHVTDAHALGGILNIRLGDFRAAIDAARDTEK